MTQRTQSGSAALNGRELLLAWSRGNLPDDSSRFFSSLRTCFTATDGPPGQQRSREPRGNLARASERFRARLICVCVCGGAGGEAEEAGGALGVPGAAGGLAICSFFTPARLIGCRCAPAVLRGEAAASSPPEPTPSEAAPRTPTDCPETGGGLQEGSGPQGAL